MSDVSGAVTSNRHSSFSELELPLASHIFVLSNDSISHFFDFLLIFWVTDLFQNTSKHYIL